MRSSRQFRFRLFFCRLPRIKILLQPVDKLTDMQRIDEGMMNLYRKG